MNPHHHTPGPWACNHTPPSSAGAAFWEITDDIDKPFAFVNEPQPRSREEMAANALLLAAAPELLDALKGMMEVTNGQTIYSFMAPQRAAALAAIEKATRTRTTWTYYEGYDDEPGDDFADTFWRVSPDGQVQTMSLDGPEWTPIHGLPWDDIGVNARPVSPGDMPPRLLLAPVAN